jgi:glycosyltransferase involved in cell wall biosynthesis
MLNDVTLLIKTFERPKALMRLLSSIADRYPQCPVLIADDSRTPTRDEVLRQYGTQIQEYVTLPFDSGLSAGRNALLERVETEYFVLNDDDFVYGPEADLHWMQNQIASSDLELLGGVYLEPETIEWRTLPKETLKKTARSVYNAARILCRSLVGPAYATNRFHGQIESDDASVALTLDESPEASPYRRCDFTSNFFMARTRAVRSKVGGWHEQLKMQEHWEFFYRAKQGGLRVAHSDDVGILHLRDRSSFYNEYRERQLEYRRLGLQLHGLRELQIGPYLRVSVEPANATPNPLS